MLNYLNHIIRSKGLNNIAGRFFMICNRFGIGARKSQKALTEILDITEQYGCTPTLCFTADLLNQNHAFIKALSTRNVDISIHGYHHANYAHMPYAKQAGEIRKAKQGFQKHGIPVSGFRAPFLQHDNDTTRAIASNGLPWSSNHIIFFSLNGNNYRKQLTKETLKILRKFYDFTFLKNTPAIPFPVDNHIEIPVSAPCDEILIDRLKIRDPDTMSTLWLDMLDTVREKGELFTFLFHPERIPFVKAPLDTLLKKTTGYKDVWIASLTEIALWWQERASFKFDISQDETGSYKISPTCSDRATLAVQHPGGNIDFVDLKEKKTFTLKTPRKPVIGVSRLVLDKVINCLRNDAFIIDPDCAPSECAFYLNDNTGGDERTILDMTKTARFPLIRFWRWPNNFKSALAITADVDSMTLIDFIRRVRYFSSNFNEHTP